MAIVFNDNIQPNAPKSLDSRYSIYESGQTRAYNNTLEVLNKLDLAVRHKGLTVLVGSDEYWFKEGILDSNLVIKTNNIDSSSFVKLTTNQTIAGEKTFTGVIIAQDDIVSQGSIYALDNLFKSNVPVLNRTENDARYILVSPSSPQTANISLIGSISNTGFTLQDSGSTSWINVASMTTANGLSMQNKPINLFGSASQKMQLKNDDTGLVISNTSNQTKFKISDLGTVTLSQLPSTGVAGAPVLVRNPTTGNIELSVGGDSNAVLLTGDQAIAGNKTFSSLGSSTVNGNLNITSGSIQDTSKSGVAYFDELGFLTTSDTGFILNQFATIQPSTTFNISGAGQARQFTSFYPDDNGTTSLLTLAAQGSLQTNQRNGISIIGKESSIARFNDINGGADEPGIWFYQPLITSKSISLRDTTTSAYLTLDKPTSITTYRTQTFQDKDGVIALLSDITGGGSSYTFSNGIGLLDDNSYGLKGDADWQYNSVVSIGSYGKALFELNGTRATLTANNNTSYLQLNTESFELTASGTVSDTYRSIKANNSVFEIIDTVNSKGIYLAEDYSQNWEDDGTDDLVLTNKKYVDDSLPVTFVQGTEPTVSKDGDLWLVRIT